MESIKKTDLIMKIVSGVFLLAILAYVAFYLLTSLSEPFKTAVAIEYTVRDSISVYGMVVRDEQALQTDYSSVYVSAAEGKRVSGGGTVGVVYSSDAELQRAERLREINTRIDSLLALKSGGSMDAQKLESSIKSEIQLIRAAAQNRELSDADNISSNIKALLFSASSDAAGIDSELSSLYSEARSLQTGVSHASAVISAPASGLFSTALDGFEDMGPDDVKNIGVAELKSLVASERSPDQKAVGKLVYGSRWYYAAIVPEEDARGFDPGDGVTMIFGRYYSEYLDMGVVSVSEPDGGSCAVVFSCSESMEDVLSMRVQSAEIILSEYTGIRIPRKAARVDDNGNVYIFARTGMQAEKEYVTIKYDIGDYYVVEGEKLRAGDTVIVSGKDLYDGKVVG